MKQTLANRLDSKKAVVGIMGLGYVGLPLVREFCAGGLKVVGFEVDPALDHVPVRGAVGGVRSIRHEWCFQGREGRGGHPREAFGPRWTISRGARGRDRGWRPGLGLRRRATGPDHFPVSCPELDRSPVFYRGRPGPEDRIGILDPVPNCGPQRRLGARKVRRIRGLAPAKLVREAELSEKRGIARLCAHLLFERRER